MFAEGHQNIDDIEKGHNVASFSSWMVEM